MAFELEHKYPCKDNSLKLIAHYSACVRQGYLSRDKERVVRIRIKGEHGYITVKGPNHGDTRIEFEYMIPIEDAEKMLEICEGKIIDKTRYLVSYEGYDWEVDEFHGDLEGLVIAEIELAESHNNYSLPPFAGEEVTGDPRYYNSNL